MTTTPESDTNWNVFLTDAVSEWQPSTAYAVGEMVRNDTNPVKIYSCIQAGTSAGSGGPSGRGSDITDGTAHWAFETERNPTYKSIIVQNMMGVAKSFTFVGFSQS